MNYILYDGSVRETLLPFTFTRPVAEIRLGTLTISEKWEKYLGTTVTHLTEEYLEEKYPMVEFSENIFIDASLLPTENLAEAISFLGHEQLLTKNGEILAFFADDSQQNPNFDNYECIEYAEYFEQIHSKTDLFELNATAIASDFKLLTEDRNSQPISKSNQVICPENVFLEVGVTLECCILNASDGPIYIGKNATVLEGAMIRGPFSLGESSVVKMGAKIYGATTIGAQCTVGGELKNVVIFGNSNKGHDGYLGNSVIGEWCNIGADTNISNMKNTHGTISVWDYSTENFEDTNLQFCGVFMGDHCKTAINTMLNSGTVLGVSSNVFGSGFPNKHTASFQWGIGEERQPYMLEKALEVAEKMYALKKEPFSAVDQRILQEVFDETKTR
jgi:UDP-N-acetylglucosamine diphosphorylase/glucosamine-1-phosphate N-acetyltransferase